MYYSESLHKTPPLTVSMSASAEYMKLNLIWLQQLMMLFFHQMETFIQSLLPPILMSIAITKTFQSYIYIYICLIHCYLLLPPIRDEKKEASRPKKKFMAAEVRNMHDILSKNMYKIRQKVTTTSFTKMWYYFIS